MLAGKSTHLLVASVLARMPNFVLPILAVRIFDFSDYSIFVVAFVTASAMSAFLGEAIAATISRESYRIGHGEHGRASLAAFFRSAVLASYVLVMAGVSIYWLFFATANGDRWLLAAATILLVPAYLLPVATTALANASGHGNIAIAASLVGVPISVVLSFLLGARFGIAYFFVAYFACVVLTHLFVYFWVASARYRNGLRAGGETLRDYGFVFMTILLPALLGGPVHGLCMAILGHQKGGAAELAVFVAYYPWSVAVSVVAAVLANYVIQMVVEIRRANDVPRLTRFLGRLLLGNVAVAVLIAACLWLGSDFVFVLYGSKLAQNQPLFGWMLVCGVGAACVSTTTQIVIGTSKGNVLVMCAALHAVLYIGLTVLFVVWMTLGADGLIRSLTFSLFTLALSHMVLIGIYLRRSVRESEPTNATA